ECSTYGFHVAPAHLHMLQSASRATPDQVPMPEIRPAFDDADAYERYMGRWSRAIGEKFLAWLAPPKDARWLDIGCGTGAFSELIAQHCAPKSLSGIDPSPQQIAFASARLPKADMRVADSMAL